MRLHLIIFDLAHSSDEKKNSAIKFTVFTFNMQNSKCNKFNITLYDVYKF